MLKNERKLHGSKSVRKYRSHWQKQVKTSRNFVFQNMMNHVSINTFSLPLRNDSATGIHSIKFDVPQIKYPKIAIFVTLYICTC